MSKPHHDDPTIQAGLEQLQQWGAEQLRARRTQLLQQPTLDDDDRKDLAFLDAQLSAIGEA